MNIRNVPWEYGDIVPDYQVGATTGVLYLSLRYHRLHPEYIHNRINNMGKMYILRVLLIMIDVDNHQEPIRELTRICITNGLTIISAWSAQEAGRYLETYKSFENKPPDLIKERVDNDYLSKLTDCLTSIRGVNKTDVVTLASTFGSLHNVIHATAEELGDCPGFGETKTKRVREAFDQPFIATSSAAKSARRKREMERREATRARDEEVLKETASAERDIAIDKELDHDEAQGRNDS